MKGRTQLLRQIVGILIPSQPELDSEASREVEDAVVSFLAAQIQSLPVYVRIPYRFALVGFEWLAVVRFGRRYVRLDDKQRRRYLHAWDQSPVGLCRDFVKLLRSCTLLAYLDHPIVARELDVAAGLQAAP